MTRLIFAALLLAVGFGTGACSKSTTAPTTTTTVAPSSEYFSGTLSPRGTQFYSFSVATAGTVSVTLASAASARIGPALPVQLSIGVGVPSGFDCAVSTAVNTAPGLAAQLTTSGAASSIYCVNISDPGVLTSDTLFVVRVSHT